MSFLADPPERDPDVERLHGADRDRTGYVADYIRALAWRPAALDAWAALNGALTAAARCFFSTVIAAAGARPDPAYDSALDPALRQALTPATAPVHNTP
jgi:hypothetical protein